MKEFNHDEEQDFAVLRFEKMLKTNNIFFFDSEEFEDIVNHYLEEGETALAKKALKIALEQHPHSSALKLLEVEALIFDDQIEKAENILDHLAIMEPSNPDIYIQKASILSKKDKHEEATQLLTRALEILGEDEEVYSLLAMEAMFLENYEKAKNYFIKCLKISPEDYTVLYNITYCFDFLDQHQEAIRFLQKYLDNFPYSEIAWHQLGLQFLAINKKIKALDCFDYAIISDDYFAGAYIEKAKVLEDLGRFKEAIEVYRQTLELQDPTAFVFLRIGYCFEQLHKDQMALEYFNRSLQEDPLSNKTWVAIIEFYLSKNLLHQALFHVKKALSLDNKNTSFWQHYALINQHLGRTEEAERGLRKSIEFGGYDFENWIARCDLLIEMTQYTSAISLLEEANLFYPHSSEIEYRLAGLYLSEQQTRLGLAHLKKGIHLDREYIFILKELFPGIFNNPDLQDFLSTHNLLN